MASNVGICNRALQKLGAARITSLTEDSRNARACNSMFETIRRSELRKHPWNFAIERAELAADSTDPDWGRAHSFQLPSDCLRLLPKYPEDNSNAEDWQIEGRKIISDDSDPIYIRYIKDVTDPNQMDSLFLESFATMLAFELCEELTQSNTKKEALRLDYLEIIREAKRVNAFENVSAKPPEDEWITVRT